MVENFHGGPFLPLEPINFVIVYREPVNDSEAGILGIFNKMISKVCNAAWGFQNYHVTVPEFLFLHIG